MKAEDYRTVDMAVDAIKKREQIELRAAMGRLQTKSYRFNEDERPLIAGWMFDEPAYIVVCSVILDSYGSIRIECYGKETGETCKKYLLADEFFPGQLTYVTDMFV